MPKVETVSCDICGRKSTRTGAGRMGWIIRGEHNQAATKCDACIERESMRAFDGGKMKGADK